MKEMLFFLLFAAPVLGASLGAQKTEKDKKLTEPLLSGPATIGFIVPAAVVTPASPAQRVVFVANEWSQLWTELETCVRMLKRSWKK